MSKPGDDVLMFLKAAPVTVAVFVEPEFQSGQVGVINHLGDFGAVQMLLHVFARKSMERLIQASKGDFTPSEAVHQDMEDARVLASVFLGKGGTKYSCVPGWNEPGAIDVYVAGATKGMVDTDPVDRLLSLFLYLIEAAHASAHLADSEPSNPDWAFEVNDAALAVTHLLVGVPQVDEVAQTLAWMAEYEEPEKDIPRG